MALPTYAAVPNTFTAGTAASAADINANFSDLDTRVGNLESGGAGAPNVVAVDCSSNAGALAAISFASNTTYNISGVCDGPIFINDKADISLVGVAAGATDSIALRAPNNGWGAVNVLESNEITIENLFLDITDFADAATANGTDAAGVYVRNGYAIVRDTNIQGGLYGISPFRSALVRLEGTVNVTEFVNSGLSVGGQSTITSRGQVTVTSTRTDGDYLTAVESYRSGVIDLRAGAILSVPASLANTDNGSAITSNENSTVRIRNSGTVSVSGAVGSFRSSSVRIEKGTITGTVQGALASSIHLKNGVAITGNLEVYSSSTLAMEGGSISGTIEVESNSSMELEEVSHTNVANQSINLRSNATLLARDSNIGNFFVFSGSAIDIDTRNGTSSAAGGEVHLGATAQISNTSLTADLALFPPGGAHLTGTTNLNNNNLYLCGTSSFVEGTVTNIANSATASSDCQP